MDRRNIGFSLVEMLISMLCVVIIMIALYDVFSKQTKINTAEQGILDMQMNARMAIERLNFLFAHAGYGCSESFATGRYLDGIGPDGDSINIKSSISNVVNKRPENGSDSVVISFGFRKIGELDSIPSEKEVDIKNKEGPRIETGENFKKYISFYPDLSGDVFYEVVSGDDPYELNAEIEDKVKKSDTDIFMVVPVNIAIENETLKFKNYVYDSGKWDIAKNVENLQLQYSSDGETWNDVPDEPQKVQAVRAFLLCRSSYKDLGYTNTKEYTLGNETVGPYNDSYHRTVVRTTVWIRSAERQ
ncbi:MAG: PilW family protein [Desulfohalobium sp.]